LIVQLNLAAGREFVKKCARGTARRHAAVSSVSLIHDVADLHHIDM
jgi:hypothetical protein